MRETLKSFIQKQVTDPEIQMQFEKAYPKTFTHQDSAGNDFNSEVVSFKTKKEIEGYDSDGNQVMKPVFVNISLSKAMKKSLGDDETFDKEWLMAHPNVAVEVDPLYPQSAKIVKEGGEQVNVNAFKKAFGL